MPAPIPLSLQDSAQHASHMLENISNGMGFNSTAVDEESITLVSVERSGVDENGQAVFEAANIDASDPMQVKLLMKTAGTGSGATSVRSNIRAKMVIRMRVTDKMDNSLGNMHGGCAASLVDNLSSLVLFMHTQGIPDSAWSFLGVSQNLTILYLNPCPIGSVVEIESSTIQVGKSVATMMTEIYTVERTDGQEDDGEGKVNGGTWKRLNRTVSGTHTKVDNSAQVKL